MSKQTSCLLFVCAFLLAGELARSQRLSLTVVPLTAEREGEQAWVGLGIQYLLANILAVHDRLNLVWFHDHASKFFREKARAHCDLEMGFIPLTDGLSVSYRLGGSFLGSDTMLLVRLKMVDYKTGTSQSLEISVQTDDGLTSFGHAFFDGMAEFGLPLNESSKRKALWWEDLDVDDLAILGMAYEQQILFNLHEDPAAIEHRSFSVLRAVMPNSYLAQSLAGWAAYTRGAKNTAKELFERAMALNPDGVGALEWGIYMGMTHLDPELVLQLVDRLATITGRDLSEEKAQHCLFFGNHYAQKGSCENAIHYLSEAIRFQPDNLAYSLILADTLVDNGDLHAGLEVLAVARTYFRDEISLRMLTQRRSGFHFGQAKASQENDHHRLAIHHFQQVLDENPWLSLAEKISVHEALLDSLLAIKDFPQALAVFRELVYLHEQELGTEHPVVIEYATDFAYMCACHEHYREAASFLGSVLKIKAEVSQETIVESLPQLFDLARFYQLMGEPKEAKSLSLKLLSLMEPLGMDAVTEVLLDMLVEAALTLYEYEEAIDFAKRALLLKRESLGSNHPKVILRTLELAILHLQLDQVRKALTLYAEARAKMINHPELSQAMAEQSPIFLFLQFYPLLPRR